MDVEIIVADDRSTDGTQRIARSFGARLIEGPLPLLAARFEAFRASTGDIIVLLDSDQFLEPGTLARCAPLLETHDCLALEESSYRADRWLSRLFEADRRFLHRLHARHLDPRGGSILPRAFRRTVLERAFAAIPERVRATAVVQDHAIIYQAASPWISSTGVVAKAVQHQEMETVGAMWRKYFSWGRNLADLFAISPESRALTGASLRTRLRRCDAPVGDYAGSLALLALKSPPYLAGFASRRVERFLEGRS